MHVLVLATFIADRVVSHTPACKQNYSHYTIITTRPSHTLVLAALI